MWMYLLYRLMSFIANTLPRSLGNWTALRIADCRYFLKPRLREAVRANLKVILGPEASAAHLHYELRWTFRSFGKQVYEFVGNRRFDARFVDRCVTFQGLEHVEAARRAGRGAVLVSAHLGNWELGPAAMSYRNIPVLSIIQAQSNPRIHRFFMSQRQGRNYKAVQVGAAARPVLRHLKDNGLLAVLGDRPYGEKGVEVDFFGRSVPFPEGPARMALASGAAYIPGFVLRRFDDSFIISFKPAISPPAGGDRDEKVRAMTQEYARILEGLVRENPSQWLPFYPVFAPGSRPEAGP